ncbi:LacI family DNA-binding transcriptional regulator [Sphingorhabdus sp.]|jgi:DNA-binding LacI/PurR family transcriptional regulator|uniref:LacI family DNA-binding transcriptional regulator n=1 Tax=Sphingorhabdus sp. TaxID=1902408 RepID=UPI0035B4CF5F|nr:LacI family DNA-binding transcriptional regulator [Sphingomonadaceae bacterium]
MAFRVTAFDVAQRAGVTQPTVSRALNGSPKVSDETRARVLEAAQELGYVINQNATRLRRGETMTLAVVLIGRAGESATETNPFYFSLLGSVAAAAAARGYNLLVSFQDSPTNFFGQYDDARQADGMIVIGTTQNPEAWAYFRGLDRPEKAWVCWGAPDDDLRWVRSENEGGGRIAARYLLDAGRRHPVFIGARASQQRQFGERYAGFAEELNKSDIVPPAIDVDEGLSREEQGVEAVRSLLQSGQRFDAIFAACDLTALGVLRALSESGISVPEQVSVIGFDGIRAGNYSSPPLTTIEPDFQQAGDLLVQNVLNRIAGEPLTLRRVPVHLVKRGS